MHNDADIASFIVEQLKVREPLDGPQWRVFFKEDYGPGQSILIPKFHHCLLDGLGFLLFLNTF